MQGPLTTRNIRRPKGRDDVQAVKRRVASVARLDHDLLHVGGRPVLARTRKVKDPAAIVAAIRASGGLDRKSVAHLDLANPLVEIDAHLLGTLERDLKVLASPPAQALLREHRRAFARYGEVDRDWLADKRERLVALLSARAPATWTDAIVAIVRSLRGEEEAAKVARGFVEIALGPTERRARAYERVARLATASDPLFERWHIARDWPLRSRRRRFRDVLKKAIGWPDLPLALIGPDFGASAQLAVKEWPLEVDAASATVLATLALAFRAGDDPLPTSFAGLDVASALKLADVDLTVGRVHFLCTKVEGASTRRSLARLVADGLELPFVEAAIERKDAKTLAELSNVRAARAWSTWTPRLAAHYGKLAGQPEVKLAPKLFESLPKNEDLGVLTLCLVHRKLSPKSDPIATLDATLGLFQRLPARARAMLSRLKEHPTGLGRAFDPELAAWLDDDELLDRAIHVAALAGEPATSKLLRAEYELVAKCAIERAHLERLPHRTDAQEKRFVALSEDRVVTRDRTQRRLRERIERLLPIAYRREIDLVFREILREAWAIDVPELIDEWREAVRFWLLVDDNRALFERMLRAAARAPGKPVHDAFPDNAAWIAGMKDKIDVAAWLAQRREEILVNGKIAFVATLEEDPLQILQMGMPFGTCLALDSCNAASTVVNAIDVNKRVLYVKNRAGKIVARKLLGVTDDGGLVGYRLYCSVGPTEANAIATAVSSFCERLAVEVRAPRASTGTPRKINGGFWYDDGEKPFETGDGAVPAYCASLRLSPVPAPWHDLSIEAEAWRARMTGDIDAAYRILCLYSDSPATREHDEWTIAKLGTRRAVRLGRQSSAVAFALLRHVADSERGVVLALDLASRLSERTSSTVLDTILARVPPSPRVAVALVGLALRAMKNRESDEHGHIHVSLDWIERHLVDVTSAFDVLDAVEPAWEWYRAEQRRCDSCVDRAVRRTIQTIEELYATAAHPEPLVAALTARHRGSYTHRAALLIASRHRLPDGERALARLAALRPDLMKTPEGFAARIRHGLDADPPAEAPFDALREMVAWPGIGAKLGPWANRRDDTKSRWEWAYRWRRDGIVVADDMVNVEAARKKLLDPATSNEERGRARALLVGGSGERPIRWAGLIRDLARIGDGETAAALLDRELPAGSRLPATAVVDLWNMQSCREAVLRWAVRTPPSYWAPDVLAAEREAALRGLPLDGLLEAIAVARACANPSTSVEVDSLAQLRRVIRAIVHTAESEHVARFAATLEDALSVAIFKEALAEVDAERGERIKELLRKRDGTPRQKTFFTWIAGERWYETV